MYNTLVTLRIPSFLPPSLVTLSFDHLVGAGEQRRWNIEVHSLCSGEVDHQIKLCRHLNRKIGCLRALENPTGMDAGAAIGVRLASPVAHQAAGVDHLTLCMERGNGVPVLQRGELPTSVEKDWATAHEERAGAPLNDRREGGIELAFICYFHGQDLPSDGATCRLDVAQFDFGF